MENPQAGLDGNAQRRRMEAFDERALAGRQLERLNALLRAILPQNRFYHRKLAAVIAAEALVDPAGPLRSLDELARLPFTFKEELLPDDPREHVSNNITFSPDRYVRFHRTSGTRGRPLAVVDTAEDWVWWLDCWQYVLDAAEITARDRVFMPFSFGPFVGFWSAFEAACSRGCLVTPGGGLSTLARLELMRDCSSTVVFCTPSYALHMVEVGLDNHIDCRDFGIRQLVLAGEPGGSTPETRRRIEAGWNAAALDHCGATEVGPWGFGDRRGDGLYVIESEFIAEFLSVESGGPAVEGELAELVLTPLGRVGCPVIRYRTGDLVRPNWQYPGPNRFVHLAGGVLGRADDMLIVRGVNVFPGSVDRILRGFAEVVEYRLTLTKAAQMDRAVVEIEDRLNDPARVATELELRLGLKFDVRAVPLGSLPRFEGKGRRIIDHRANS